MLNQIRYQQQYQQLQNRIIPGVGTVVTYGDRDPATGQRTIETADGSRSMALYLSNSVPDRVVAIARFSPIGLPGYISQKPY